MLYTFQVLFICMRILYTLLFIRVYVCIFTYIQILLPLYMYISLCICSCTLFHPSLQDGNRAIDLAKAVGHMEVVKLLLESGAQVCTQ